ncbi:MAG: hypothetical protein RLZZ618_594 [Pseudomonadota bacterium]|jgi:AraC-like DNA-binding protein
MSEPSFLLSQPLPLPLLNIAVRGGLVTLLLLAAALLLRRHGQAPAARWGAFFAIGVAAYAVCSAPGFSNPPVAWQAPLLVLSAGNSVVFWIFANALFNDEFRWRVWHAAAWLMLAIGALANCFVLAPAHSPWTGTVATALTLAPVLFAALSLAVAVSTWHTDLVEGRRRLRGFIVGSAALYSAAAAVAKMLDWQGPGLAAASLADALGMFVITLAIVWPLLGDGGRTLFDESREALPLARLPPVDSPGLDLDIVPPSASGQAHAIPDANARAAPAAIPQSHAPSQPPAPAPDAPDAALIAALASLMASQHVHREEQLTIGSLAARLDVPEYKLRRAINQGLGYRNFNVFLNRYRIDEARRALSDAAQAEVPVLTIAMDCGFQSLGPFNRAFKSETGLTPTEYRKQAAQAH